jgi:hypothetical protein
LTSTHIIIYYIYYNFTIKIDKNNILNISSFSPIFTSMEDSIIECYLPHFLFKEGDQFICKKINRPKNEDYPDYPKYFVYKYNKNGFQFDMFETSYILQYKKEICNIHVSYGRITVGPFFRFLTECMLNHEIRIIIVRFFNNLRKYLLKEIVYEIFIQHMHVTISNSK